MRLNRLIVGLLFCGSLFAQRSDTIWQQLTNVAVSPTNAFTSTPVSNIGQTGHTVFINLTGGGCSPTLLAGGLYYSWDNVTYFPFGNQLTTGVASNITLTGTGAYPFVIVKFTYQACTATAFYTGVVQSPFTLSQGTLPVNTTVNLLQTTGQNFIPQPLVQGYLMGVDTSGSVSNGILAVNVEGGATANVSVAVGTTGRVTTNQTGVGNRVWVSHIDITTDTNATVATLLEGQGTTCATNQLVLGTFNLQTGQVLTVGKFRSQVIADNLCLTAATGTVKGSITYGVLASATGGSGQ